MLLRFYGSDMAFGQFWVMCDGKYGGYGNPGNEESITCRFYWDRQSSNPPHHQKTRDLCGFQLG
jgi:hypothetical protein